MNILIISHYAGNPEMGMVFRPYYFAKEWMQLNHETTIITASFTHIRKMNPKIKKDFDESYVNGVRYVWIKTPYYTNLIQRGINILSFIFKLHVNAKKLAKKYRPDIVIASSTYNFEVYSAAKIAKYAKAKLVYEVRDLWPLTPIELGHYSKYNPFIMFLQYAENTAYKYADYVISALPCVHKHMKNHGLDLNKLMIIPNGIFKNDWTEENIEALTDRELILRLKSEKEKGHIIVGFTGAHNQATALEYLLYAAEILKEKKISFILVGDGKRKPYLQNYVKEKQLSNVFLCSYISKKEVPDLLSYFDITYIGWHNLPIYRFGISPNKLMDYMMVGKPILHSVNAANDPVKEAGCGITVEPENPQAIAEGLLKLAALSTEERYAMGQRGREYILKNQTYDILAKKFLDFITKRD